jgi:hypothetical protein
MTPSGNVPPSSVSSSSGTESSSTGYGYPTVTRARPLLAQTHIPMEVAVLLARDHRAVHPSVVHRAGPAHPDRQIWRQLCPPTLPL